MRKSQIQSHELKTVKIHFDNGHYEKAFIGKIMQVREDDFKFKMNGKHKSITIKYKQVIDIQKPDHMFAFEYKK